MNVLSSFASRLRKNDQTSFYQIKTKSFFYQFKIFGRNCDRTVETIANGPKPA